MAVMLNKLKRLVVNKQEFVWRTTSHYLPVGKHLTRLTFYPASSKTTCLIIDFEIWDHPTLGNPLNGVVPMRRDVANSSVINLNRPHYAAEVLTWVLAQNLWQPATPNATIRLTNGMFMLQQLGYDVIEDAATLQQ